MVMFEIIGTFIVLTILFFVTGGHKRRNVGKYSEERQRKRFRETGNKRYLYDRDYD